MSMLIAGMIGLQLMVFTQAAADEVPPPLGFLDYLGSMVELEGELIDPLSLEAAQERTAEAEVPAKAEATGGGGTAADAEEVR